MIMNNKIIGIFLALLAALFYALSTPFSKILLENVEPMMLASILYIGAGIGISLIYIFLPSKKKKEEVKLEKSDLPFVISMVVLDIIAPILLMVGLMYSNASTVFLLNNFEIVATSLIALLIFKEKINIKVWIAIFLIILSSALLTFDNLMNFELNIGSIFVILATISWGIENNCTKKISNKSTYQIVIIKGLFSGLGSLIVALISKEKIPQFEFILYGLALGFVAYGLSIFTYIRAQKEIGAAKTSSFYSTTPFIGAILSLLILKEEINFNYYIALAIMVIATFIIVFDTLFVYHKHNHSHKNNNNNNTHYHLHLVGKEQIHNHHKYE